MVNQVNMSMMDNENIQAGPVKKRRTPYFFHSLAVFARLRTLFIWLKRGFFSAHRDFWAFSFISQKKNLFAKNQNNRVFLFCP